ncbi:MAG: Bug family tripartite tricarboxylate transporter substrate binding protein [Xanthobacteraceae bacterium]
MARLHSRLMMAAGLVLALTTAAQAQQYPTKQVRIVIPFAPGGLNDLVGRMVATQLSTSFGRQVIPDNRTGAGGVVGSEIVSRAPADGHTLLIVSIANAVNPWIRKLNYDPKKAFIPIAGIVSSENVLAVNNDLPAKTVKEFIALAKKSPGKMRYASGGVGGSLHLAMELFKVTAGIDLLHIPFKGAGPGVIDVIGNHTQAINGTISTLSPHIRAGKLRALAVTGDKPSPALPGVPTFAQAGVQGYDAGNWIGLAAPAGTPASVIARLQKEIAAMQKTDEFKKQLANHGSEVLSMGSAEFAKFMDNETAKWGKVVKQAGIKAK